MRSIAATVLALGSSSASAAAGQCYWVGRQIYCDAGCRVTDRWWDGRQEWMQWSCGPPPEVLAAVGIVVLAILVVVLIRSAASSTGSALSTAADEADARAHEAEVIARRLKAARAEADRFLQSYRDR